MIATLAMTAAGAALSYWGEQQRISEEEKQRKAQIMALEKAKIDKSEENALLSGINREFNTIGTSQANRMAFGVGAVLNKDTVRGLTASTLLGERAKAITSTQREVLSTNSQLDAQIAGVPEVSGTNIGNVAMGGIAGAQIGQDFEKMGLSDSSIGDFFGGGSEADVSGISGVLKMPQPINSIGDNATKYGSTYTNNLLGGASQDAGGFSMINSPNAMKGDYNNFMNPEQSQIETPTLANVFEDKKVPGTSIKKFNNQIKSGTGAERDAYRHMMNYERRIFRNGL